MAAATRKIRRAPSNTSLLQNIMKARGELDLSLATNFALDGVGFDTRNPKERAIRIAVARRIKKSAKGELALPNAGEFAEAIRPILDARGEEAAREFIDLFLKHVQAIDTAHEIAGARIKQRRGWD